MRAGRLRHYATIEQPTESNDAEGQAIKSWSTYAQGYVGIEPLRGRAFVEAQQINSQTTVRVIMRGLTGVTDKMRVSWGGKLYNILWLVNVDERAREIHAMCSEGTNDG